MGDMVMFRKEQGSVEPQDIWRGPARIIGFDKNTTWLSFEAGVVASALHLLRPPTAAELLAWVAMNRLTSSGEVNITMDSAGLPTPSRLSHQQTSAAQTGYIDTRRSESEVNERVLTRATPSTTAEPVVQVKQEPLDTAQPETQAPTTKPPTNKGWPQPP